MLTAVFLMAAGRTFTLVIDPGHGGKDAGAPGKMSYEKDINLKVALAFGRYVEKNCADVKVLYTRKTDVFVELIDRANFANKNKADLFISIHTNALEGGRISRGLETYTLGMHRAADNLNVAKRENSVILYEKNYKQSYAGFDPKSAESYIMFELMQDKHMANSVEMAKLIQSEVCAQSGRVNKGIHQAGFLVLRETSMPSCLIELGFITTPDEEQFLNTQEGQDKMGKGIYNAFVKYKKKYGNSKLSANDDRPSEDQEARLLAMADKDFSAANLVGNEEELGNNNNVENQPLQSLITEDALSSAVAEYTEQREVRQMLSEPSQPVGQIPQNEPSQIQPADNPPLMVSSPPPQLASTPPQLASTPPQPAPTPPQPAPTSPQPASTPPQPASTSPQPAPPSPQLTSVPSSLVVKSTESVVPVSEAVKEQPNLAKKDIAKPEPKDVPATEIKKDTSPAPKEKMVSESPKETANDIQENKKEPVKPASEPKAEPAKPAPEPKAEPVKPAEEIPVHGPVFKVQIAAASQQIPTTSHVFQGVENIDSYQENGMVKYTVGASPDFDEISNLRKELLSKFPQAFVIAFKDGEKTDLAGAIREYKTIKNKRN